MTYPRAHLIDEDEPGFYHLISECVRRSFLCGVDSVSGRDFSHRQRFLEARMVELTHYFAIDVYAYAVMSNHYHVVIRTEPERVNTWSLTEVAERWHRAMQNPNKSHSEAVFRQRVEDTLQRSTPERMEVLRGRLKSVSWYAARINEVMARMANEEDNCRGRFWEGRFHSERLLKEDNVLRGMVYADLNPVRAGITKRLEASACNGARARIDAVRREPEQLDQVIRPFSKGVDADEPLLTLTTREYIELVRWTGENIVYADKASLPKPPPGDYFERLGISPATWLSEVSAFSKRRRVRGSKEDVKAYGKHMREKVKARRAIANAAPPAT